MADIDSPIQHGSHERAKFRAMTEGTQEDWSLISSEYMAFARDLPDRVLAHLKLLDGDFGGFPVDRQHARIGMGGTRPM